MRYSSSLSKNPYRVAKSALEKLGRNLLSNLNFDSASENIYMDLPISAIASSNLATDVFKLLLILY